MNKQELKSAILVGRDRLEAVLNLVGDSQKQLIILHGEWSVKDLLGHLYFWQDHVYSEFSLLKSGKSPEKITDYDAINQAEIRKMAPIPLEDVKKMEEESFQRLLSLVDTADDLELFDPNHFAWTNGQSFGDYLYDYTIGHYDEHIPEVIAWLKRVA